MCAVNVPRCRKQGICDTGVVKKACFRLIYNTGLMVLLVHQDTAYLAHYWAVSFTGPFRVHGSFNHSPTPCQTSRDGI